MFFMEYFYPTTSALLMAYHATQGDMISRLNFCPGKQTGGSSVWNSAYKMRAMVPQNVQAFLLTSPPSSFLYLKVWTNSPTVLASSGFIVKSFGLIPLFSLSGLFMLALHDLCFAGILLYFRETCLRLTLREALHVLPLAWRSCFPRT